MESSAARQVAILTPHDLVRIKFQGVLDAMDKYMREKPETVSSPTSARLLNVKEVATKIYEYYFHGDHDCSEKVAKQIQTFESNLGDMQNAVIANKRVEKEGKGERKDLTALTLLPKIPPNKTPPFPFSLHGFHAAMVDIMRISSVIYSQTGWSSRLSSDLANAAEGHEVIAQELGTNVYVVLYCNKVDRLDVLQNPIKFAGFLCDSLGDPAIYKQHTSTKNFEGSYGRATSAQIYFEENKAALLPELLSIAEGACIGMEFCFQISRSNLKDPGVFIPLLRSAHLMEVWSVRTPGSATPYHLNYNEEEKSFAIVSPPKRATSAKK